MLLQEYERTKDANLLKPIRRGMNFAVSLIKEYDLPSGKKAGYYYYNTKAKLGGSGLSLYLLAEYQRITGDNAFAPYARLLHQHLLAQILPSGEFMYYAIYKDKPVSPKKTQNTLASTTLVKPLSGLSNMSNAFHRIRMKKMPR